MKNNRILSFVAITLIYIIASVVGIVIYNFLRISIWVNLLIADVIATIIVFAFSLIFKNASVYDPYWSVQPVVIITAFAVSTYITVFKVLLILAICYWGIRLTANWAYTFKNLNHQDWRYTNLQQKTKNLYPAVNLLGIHLFPTIVVYLCTLPAVYAIVSTNYANIGFYIFIILSFIAPTLQLIADIQMHKFRKKQSQNIMNSGLWAYSRHPNYLGEIIMWWGICLSCVCIVGFYWYMFLGAIVNTLMFLFISIPMAENKLQHKTGFEEYKQTTSMLLILPKKKIK